MKIEEIAPHYDPKKSYTFHEFLSLFFFGNTELDKTYLPQYEDCKKKFTINSIQQCLNKIIENRDKTPLFLNLTQEKLQFFIDEGLDLNINFKDKKGRNALFFKQNKFVLNYLLDNGIECYTLDNDKNHCLYYANKEMLEVFLERDTFKEYPPEILIKSNNLEAIDYLLKNKKVDVNHLFSNEQNALFFTENLNKMELLIQYGINVNEKNSKGFNVAMYTEKVEILKFLEKNGIDLNETYNIEDRNYNLLSINKLSHVLFRIIKNSNHGDYNKTKRYIKKRYQFTDSNYYNTFLSKEKFDYLYFEKKVPILPEDELGYLLINDRENIIDKHIDLVKFIKNNEDELLNNNSLMDIDNIIIPLLNKVIKQHKFVFNQDDISKYHDKSIYINRPNEFENLFLKSMMNLKKVKDLKENKSNKPVNIKRKKKCI